MNNKEKNLTFIGFLLIAVSLLFLYLSGKTRDARTDLFSDAGAFFANYLISIGYIISVLVFHRTLFKYRKVRRHFFIITLILFSISCFTLNHEMTMFAPFPAWVTVYLVLFYAAYLALGFIQKIPGSLRALIFFFVGSGLVLMLYFTFYLAPTYPIALVGLIFLGFTVHLLIPMFVGFNASVLIFKTKKSSIQKWAFIGGIMVPLIITGIFLYRWNDFKNHIHEATSSVITRPDNTLPEWILLCQQMPDDPFSKKIISGSLVYDTFEDMWFGGWSRTMFDEVKKHDPLVNVGMAFLGDINIDDNSRVKILKSQYDARHLAQRKLWTGKDLKTIEVLNNTKIYPDYRLAYSEKIITVKNMSRWTGNQQEAAFTFYLPEGSVATSLSLWIEGKEEKSRLTTKSKADSAYVSIVGVERRDPALMHWQEGNTLTVTVFPCTPIENRRFKIGITTPLILENETLKYENVYFDGPSPRNLRETSRISFVTESEINDLQMPNGYNRIGGYEYEYTGKFTPFWEVALQSTPIADKHFSFRGKSYSIEKYKPENRKFIAQKIYLDINKSWTQQEFETIISAASDKQIWVHYDKFVKVTNENSFEIFKQLNSRNFSLFPFHQLTNPEHSLVISKSNRISPNLSDLKGSKFMDDMTHELNNNSFKYNLFHLNNELSPYLKSLKEFQVFNFVSGDIQSLRELLAQNEFIAGNKNFNQLDLDLSGISILRDDTTMASEAPDHLLRLFAYNRIMKELGPNYFQQDKAQIDSLTKIANEAYVVSPVSSLIVLETLKDYERFGIEENKNSLKNATVNSSGAVPEPSEWLLIILFVGLVGYLYYRNQPKLLWWKK